MTTPKMKATPKDIPKTSYPWNTLRNINFKEEKKKAVGLGRTVQRQEHRATSSSSKPQPKEFQRSRSELFTKRLWKGKAKKQHSESSAERKKSKEKPMKHDPKTKVCLEECKVPVIRNGKKVECGRLCDIEKAHTICRCKDHKKPKSPPRVKKEEDTGKTLVLKEKKIEVKQEEKSPIKETVVL
jgi:hypothetical protein